MVGCMDDSVDGWLEGYIDGWNMHGLMDSMIEW